MDQTPHLESLSERERSNLAAVHEHIAAANAAFSEPGQVHRVGALLAENFVWCTPSSDGARGVERSRQLYLDIIAQPTLPGSPDAFASLQLKLVATTAQGNRVAAECESYGVRNDGIVYHNYYHQLWLFDAAGKIAAYKIYDDSKHVADVQIEGNIKKVLEHLRQRTAGAAGASSLEVVPDSIIAQDNRVSVSARDPAARGLQGVLYQFVYELEDGAIKSVREFRETERDSLVPEARQAAQRKVERYGSAE
jgi:ketosteroid isomerase-like protein